MKSKIITYGIVTFMIVVNTIVWRGEFIRLGYAQAQAAANKAAADAAYSEGWFSCYETAMKAERLVYLAAYCRGAEDTEDYYMQHNFSLKNFHLDEEQAYEAFTNRNPPVWTRTNPAPEWPSAWTTNKPTK